MAKTSLTMASLPQLQSHKEKLKLRGNHSQVRLVVREIRSATYHAVNAPAGKPVRQEPPYDELKGQRPYKMLPV